MMGVRMTRLKDPRLVAGVILIAASAVVGGTLLAGPPVIRVYRAVEAVIPGTPIADAGLEIAEVPPGVAGPYVTVGESGTVAEVLQPGELLARSSLGEADDAVALVLPVALPPASALTAGSTWKSGKCVRKRGAKSQRPALFLTERFWCGKANRRTWVRPARWKSEFLPKTFPVPCAPWGRAGNSWL